MAADRSDIGSRLRAAREARGTSLRDIAARTKISVSALEALERNDVSRLPGGLFSRAFVRAYAKEVGLDPDEAAREFDARWSAEGEAGSVDRVERGRRPTAGASTSRAGVGWFGLAITLVLVVVWIGVDRYYNRRAEGQPAEGRPTATDTALRPPPAPPMPTLESPKPPVPPPAAPAASAPATGTGGAVGAPGPGAPASAAQSTPPVEPQPSAPAATPPTAAPPSPVADAAAPLRLVLSPRNDCWVSVSVDGNRTPGRLLKAGEKMDVAAGQSIALTAGDASALDYTINGSPGRPLGGAGQVVTVVINTGNYRTFYAARPPQ